MKRNNLNITQIWQNSLELIAKRPILLLPFIIFGCIKGIALEFLYFSSRKPISFVISPIVRKFFGERFIHYPGNILLLPKLFYYAQTFIYISIGIFLAGISINIFKDIKAEKTLKPAVIIKNTAGHYMSFLGYGLIAVIIIFIARETDLFILRRCFGLASNYAPNFVARVAPFITTLAIFLTNVFTEVFLALALPIIVIKKRPLFKALRESAYLGIRNFFGLFALLVVPFFMYLPISLLKLNHVSAKLAGLTFPEINVYIIVAGIVASLLIDCFVVICASQFLLDRGEVGKAR